MTMRSTGTKGVEAQRTKDEEIIASVIAYSEIGKHVVRQGSFAETVVDYSDPDAEPVTFGACCAVGAGVLYRGIRARSPQEHNHNHDYLKLFAREYAVTEAYAIGVSDGFEDCIGATTVNAKQPEYDDPDYERGWAVGAAIATAVL